MGMPFFLSPLPRSLIGGTSPKCPSYTNLMPRAFECESVVFCGAAARQRRAAAPCWGGGQPRGLAAAKTALSIQKVFDCKWYYHSGTLYRKPVLHLPTPYALSPLFKGGEGRGEGGSYIYVPCPFGVLLVTLYQSF
jgi:hypothetical protein